MAHIIYCVGNLIIRNLRLESNFCCYHLNTDTGYVHVFQLILSVAMNGHSIQSSAVMNLLPSASSIVSLADSQDRATFATIMKMKEEPMDVVVDSNKEEVECYCQDRLEVL